MMLAMLDIRSLRLAFLYFLGGIFGASLVCQCMLAQGNAAPKSISEAEARQHLKKTIVLVYPPIAKAAQIQGEVKISISIDANGLVASEKVLSGPAMLQQAALDAVKKCQFTPFSANHLSIPVTTTLTIPFHLEIPQLTSEQEKAAQAWFPLLDKCLSELKTENADEALNYCKQALEMSFKAGDLTNSDQLGRLESHQLYGHALLLVGRVQEALEQENLAIAEAKKCVTEKNEEYATPFYWRAIAEARLGHGDAALADFQIAEETYRRAIANLPDMKQNYSRYLAVTLKTHAALLDSMGRSAEADKLRTEAAAL
jgi:TonB family protein